MIGPVDDGQSQPGGFCVVANIAKETARGEGGLELRPGAEHFAVETKLWVLPPQWGDGGDRLTATGNHRGHPRPTRAGTDGNLPGRARP